MDSENSLITGKNNKKYQISQNYLQESKAIRGTQPQFEAKEKGKTNPASLLTNLDISSAQLGNFNPNEYRLGTNHSFPTKKNCPNGVKKTHLAHYKPQKVPEKPFNLMSSSYLRMPQDSLMAGPFGIPDPTVSSLINQMKMALMPGAYLQNKSLFKEIPYINSLHLSSLALLYPQASQLFLKSTKKLSAKFFHDFQQNQNLSQLSH